MAGGPPKKASEQSKRVGFYNVMEAYSATPNYNSHVDSYRSKSPQRTNTPPSDTDHGDSSPRSVSFGRTIKREEEKDKRQKFLTARYGQHQMMLIRKRLAVEDWLYEKLRDLYNCQVDEQDHDCQLDLEDILNLDTDNERLQYAYENLSEAKQPPDLINAFVKELLQKAKTL